MCGRNINLLPPIPTQLGIEPETKAYTLTESQIHNNFGVQDHTQSTELPSQAKKNNNFNKSLDNGYLSTVKRGKCTYIRKSVFHMLTKVKLQGYSFYNYLLKYTCIFMHSLHMSMVFHSKN